MKKMIKVSLVALATVIAFNASADDSVFDGLTCAGKEKAIKTQIDYAKKAKNTYQVQGLEKALSDVLTYCTNEGLEEKYKDKVQDELNDLYDRQAELKEAKDSGKVSKIAKQEAKVKEAEYALKDAQNKLDSFYKALKAEK